MTSKELKKHEKEYYHIPKGRLRYVFLTLIGILLCIGMYHIVVDSWVFLELGDLDCIEGGCDYHSHQLMIIPLIIMSYIIISLTILSFVSMFKKLKPYNKIGLIWALIEGFIGGLFFGLIGGLIVGLFLGLMFGSIFGLIEGLVFGLIVGLITGLIWEFIE